MQQASSSATQSSTAFSPRATEPTLLPVVDQEPEGSRKRQRYWEEDSTESEEELDPRVLLSINTPENGKRSG